MDKIRKYVVSLCVMLIVSMVLLVLVSVLTYVFKWQADKVMIGMIVTYVCAGVAGGVSLKKIQQRKLKGRILDAFIMTAFFTVTLILLSRLLNLNAGLFSERFLLICLLIAGGSFIGISLKR